MADTVGVGAYWSSLITDEYKSFAGGSFHIPIFTKTPERRAWDDAIAWLEARKAADAEWPWPKRADYPIEPGDPGYGYA